MRTFSRSDWDAAQQAWRSGEFSDEWRRFRHEAAMRGMLYPPEGSKWDSWDEDNPSQRAQLIRSIRETPNLVHEAIARSRSWYEVISFINRRRDDWRNRQRLEDAFDEARYEGPTDREATQTLAAILKRISDSAA